MPALPFQTALINEEKATVIIQNIAYNNLNNRFGTEIFTEPTLKGRLRMSAIPANKHLCDYVIFNSPSVEKPFAQQLDTYQKLMSLVKYKTVNSLHSNK